MLNGIRMSSCRLEIKYELSDGVCPTMVNWKGVVMKPGKYHRSKKIKQMPKIYAGRSTTVHNLLFCTHAWFVL